MLKICVYSTFLVLLIKTIICQKSYKSEKLCPKKRPVLFIDNNKRVGFVEIVFKNNIISDCNIYGNKYSPQKTIAKHLCKHKVSYVSTELLYEWAIKCSEWLMKRSNIGKGYSYSHSVPRSDSDVLPMGDNKKIDKSFFEKMLIFPGTKWCGKGNIARDDNDLGQNSDTDQCCRAHDRCFDSIPGKESKYNLTNTATFTKSHCDCDDEFRKCLKTVDSSVANTVFNIFFKIIQIQCFKNYYPIIECLEYKQILWTGKSCQKYSFDYKLKRVYQFFDPSFV